MLALKSVEAGFGLAIAMMGVLVSLAGMIIVWLAIGPVLDGMRGFWNSAYRKTGQD